MNATRFAERHPYWFVVLLEVVVIVIYLVAGTIAHFVNFSTMGLYGLANLGLTVTVAVVLTATGWWKAVGFRTPDRRSDLLYFLVPFIPMFLNLIPGIQLTDSSYVLEVFGIMLLVGFVEESIFRGLMLNAKPAAFGKQPSSPHFSLD